MHRGKCVDTYRRRLMKALAGSAVILHGHRAPLAAARADMIAPARDTLAEFIQGLPKAELHLHLEGVTDPTLAFELAERNGVSLAFANPEAFERSLEYSSLESFLFGFEQMLSVLVEPEDFRDAALHYFRKAHAQNLVYVEMHFDPQAHMRRGIDFDAVIEGVREARRIAAADLGIQCQIIMALQRDADLESAAQALAHARRHRDLIVGLGLDNYEEAGFPAKFEALFRESAAHGFQLTSHCDLEVPDSIDHVRGCLDLLGVQRLDHGYSVLEDPLLVQACTERQIGLTACPTTDWNHPDVTTDPYVAAVTESIGAMLELGLLVSVNSDDPGLMGNRYVGDILLDVSNALNLQASDVATLARNAFVSSWAPQADLDRYLKKLDEYAARHAA
jgi:adenosine deaminase